VGPSPNPPEDQSQERDRHPLTYDYDRQGTIIVIHAHSLSAEYNLFSESEAPGTVFSWDAPSAKQPPDAAASHHHEPPGGFGEILHRRVSAFDKARFLQSLTQGGNTGRERFGGPTAEQSNH
jgi:hypothetical protein